MFTKENQHTLSQNPRTTTLTDVTLQSNIVCCHLQKYININIESDLYVYLPVYNISTSTEIKCPQSTSTRQMEVKLSYD